MSHLRIQVLKEILPTSNDQQTLIELSCQITPRTNREKLELQQQALLHTIGQFIDLSSEDASNFQRSWENGLDTLKPDITDVRIGLSITENREPHRLRVQAFATTGHTVLEKAADTINTTVAAFDSALKT